MKISKPPTEYSKIVPGFGQRMRFVMAMISGPSVIAQIKCSRDMFLIMHFVGAAERSATTHPLVQRLLDELIAEALNGPPTS